jgi:hypothetical protein
MPVLGPQLADAPPLPWAQQAPAQAPAQPPGPPPVPYGAGAPAAVVGPPPGPLPPGVAGPPPATVRELPGVDVRFEPPPSRVDELTQQYAGHILDIPDDEARTHAWEDLYARHPEEAIRQSVAWTARNERDVEAKRYELSTKNWEAQKSNWEARVRADQRTQQKMDEVVESVKRIAATKIDPAGGVQGGAAIAGILGAMVGGLVQGRTGAARNAGLDALDATINRGIEAQRAQLANQMQAATFERSALGEEFQRHGDMHVAAETVRLASYQHAIDQLNEERQKYAFGGTTSMRIGDEVQALRQRQVTAFEALRKGTLEEHLKQEEQARKTAETASTIGKNAAEVLKLQAEAAKLGRGTGEGSATNPKYTVATGWFNPFDAAQPVMGKRAIGGKGEDAKERKKVDDELSTYAHVQDYWAKLSDLGARIGYAKSLGESAWKARRGTLESEYDAAKEALTVYLTKELGDKLTQGQLEAQAHRIPDRASVFEARDPGAQISAAQEDADRDFARDMDLVGIDPAPIIRGAQLHRVRALPSPEAALDAANSALAADPDSRDAQRERDAAEERVQSAAASALRRTTDIAAARSLPPPPPKLPAHDLVADLAGKEGPQFEPYRQQQLGLATAIDQANRATSQYEALQRQFRDGDTKAHLKGLKLPGDIAAASKAHEAKLGAIAREVLQARATAEAARAKARELLDTEEISRRMQLRQQAIRAGRNPDDAAPPPRSAPPRSPESRSGLHDIPDPQWPFPFSPDGPPRAVPPPPPRSPRSHGPHDIPDPELPPR